MKIELFEHKDPLDYIILELAIIVVIATIFLTACDGMLADTVAPRVQIEEQQ